MSSRSISERSPVSVMRWDDSSTIASAEFTKHDDHRTGPLSKGIRWSDRNSVHHITHLDDMPQTEIAEIWYDSKEYSEIKSAYQLTIFMMESGEAITGDEHTSRGLEYRTQEGAWARYENKRDAYNAVLDEQDRQWQVDKDDHDKIRQIYLKHSTKCANAAIVRALQDERDIKDYVRGPPLASTTTTEEKPKRKKKNLVIKKKKTSTSSNDSQASASSATSSSSSSNKNKAISGGTSAKAMKARIEQRLAANSSTNNDNRKDVRADINEMEQKKKNTRSLI